MKRQDPYARQRILPEVGDEGQERLSSTVFKVSASLSPWGRKVAQSYARACGFLESGEERPCEPHPLTPLFRHSAARDVALGAADVLTQALPHFDLKGPRS